MCLCVFVCVDLAVPAVFSVAEQSRAQIPVRLVFTKMETPVGHSLTGTEQETLSG